MLQIEAKKQNGATAGDFQLANGADFACPLTGLPMNGRYRFSVLRKTGHVLSEKALKEVDPSSHTILLDRALCLAEHARIIKPCFSL